MKKQGSARHHAKYFYLINKNKPQSLYFLNKYKAFTLIEMLVVIAIISILAEFVLAWSNI